MPRLFAHFTTMQPEYEWYMKRKRTNTQRERERIENERKNERNGKATDKQYTHRIHTDR